MAGGIRLRRNRCAGSARAAVGGSG